MHLIKKVLALFGWAFVVALGVLMLVINCIPIVLLLIYSLKTRQSPGDVVELVLSHLSKEQTKPSKR
jgi:hypothetical protein